MTTAAAAGSAAGGTPSADHVHRRHSTTVPKLQVSYSGVKDKLAQINATLRRKATATELGMPRIAKSPVAPPLPRICHDTHMATALRTHTRGVYCLEAAAELLAAQRWLQRPDFIGKSLSITPSVPDGQPSATVNWAAAITALDAGELPCSGCEQRMLRITASIGGGIPVNLQDSLTGIDEHNVQLILRAVLHASGRHPK
jgi:hypothetical protein